MERTMIARQRYDRAVARDTSRADRRAVNRFRAVACAALVVLVTIAATGCASNDVAYDPDDITIDATVRDMADACTEAGGHMSQSDGACYLPPVYGTDC